MRAGETQGFDLLGRPRVLLQERETTAEGVRMKSVVWITEGTLLFDVLYSTCVPFPSSRKDCAVLQTQKPSVFKTLFGVCPTAYVLISRNKQMLLMMLGRKKSLDETHEAHRDQNSSSTFFLAHQPDVTSHLGPDLVQPSRPVRAEDEMSVQEHETTRVPLTHSSASEKNSIRRSCELQLNWKCQHRQCLRVASRPNALRIRWIVRIPRDYQR